MWCYCCSLSVQFYVMDKAAEGGHDPLPGAQVAAILQKKLRSDGDVLDFPVLKIDTVGGSYNKYSI